MRMNLYRVKISGGWEGCEDSYMVAALDWNHAAKQLTEFQMADGYVKSIKLVGQVSVQPRLDSQETK